MKTLLFSYKFLLLTLMSLPLALCSSDNEDEIDNPGTEVIDPTDDENTGGTIDHQDVTEQVFSAVRIGASSPNEEDIVASSGARMPLSGSAFYNTQNQLNKTTFGFYGTVIGDANGTDIPGYGEVTDKSYKSVNFYILSQEDIDNGIAPNGKLLKNVEIDVGNNIGNDLWGGSMSPLNAAGYTIEKTDNSDILGTTTNGEIITDVTFNDVTDSAITSQFSIYMDKFVTNLSENSSDGFTKSSILETLKENELNILIIESFTNINGTLQQKKYTN